MAILDTLPDLKYIGIGAMEASSGRDPRTVPWPITDAGFPHLANCKKVEYLGISSQHPLTVTDDGLKVLEGMTALRRVEIMNQRFTDAGIAHLSRLKNLEELWLDFNDQLGDASLAAVSGLTKLRVLRFYQAPLTDAGIAKIKGLTQLEDLQLGHALVGDEGMTTIGTFTKLKTLDLQHTRITDAGMERLKNLRLHWICINGTRVTSKGVAALAGMKDLEWLIAEETAVDDTAMETVAGFKHLISLYLSKTKVTDAGLAKVKGLEELANLNVDDLPLTDASVETLLSFKKLKNLQMNHTQITPAGEKRLLDAGVQIVNRVR
jgi:Leucine-rich repeat (LRR) protein